MRRVRLSDHDGDLPSRWWEVATAYPSLRLPIPTAAAEAIEATVPSGDLSAVAAYLHIDAGLDNLHLQAAVLAARYGQSMAGWTWQALSLAPSGADHPEWQAELQAEADGLLRCIDLMEPVMADNSRLPELREALLAAPSASVPGGGIGNAIKLLIWSYISTIGDCGLVIDTGTTIGPLSVRSNVVAATRDVYLAVAGTIQTAYARQAERMQELQDELTRHGISLPE